ncbi:MAG: hypothetical protein ACI8PZ_003346 [Myxococcota bacterium]|jgi:hypothetical protein
MQATPALTADIRYDGPREGAAMGGFTEVWVAFLIVWVWLRVLVVKRPEWVWLGRTPYFVGIAALACFMLAFSATMTQLPGSAPVDGGASPFRTFNLARTLAWCVAAAGLGANIYFTWAHFSAGSDGAEPPR